MTSKQEAEMLSSVVEGLNQSLSEFRKWRHEAKQLHQVGMIQGLTSLKFNDLPCMYYAYHLGPLFDDRLKQYQYENGAEGDFHDPEQFESLKESVRAWLSKVDQDERIISSLKPFLSDRRKCAAVAELLVCLKIFPSREEILIGAIASSRYESNLPKQVAAGHMLDFTNGVDMFLQFLEIDVSGDIFPELLCRANEAHVHFIWRCVDLDGDGLLSQEESMELCRFILSSPPLGRLVATAVCNSMASEDSNQSSVERMSVILIVPSVVLAFIEGGIGPISKNFWLSMDKDGDGEVTKEEFCELFQYAFWSQIFSPLASKVQAALESNDINKVDVDPSWTSSLRSPDKFTHKPYFPCPPQSSRETSWEPCFPRPPQPYVPAGHPGTCLAKECCLRKVAKECYLFGRTEPDKNKASVDHACNRKWKNKGTPSEFLEEELSANRAQLMGVGGPDEAEQEQIAQKMEAKIMAVKHLNDQPCISCVSPKYCNASCNLM